jgi:DnaJ-class molecular chaperone
MVIIHRRLTGDTVFELFVVAAFFVVLYVLSLKLNPYVRCSRCKNKPKRKAWTFSYAHHVCSKCQGTGQQLRFGRRFIFGRPVKAGDR